MKIVAGVALMVGGVMVGSVVSLAPRTAILGVLTWAALALAVKAAHGDGTVAALLLGSYVVRLSIGLLQAQSGFFVSNADSVVYENLARFLLLDGLSGWSAHVPEPFQGIVLIDYLVGSVPGVPSLALSLAWLASTATLMGCALVLLGTTDALSATHRRTMAALLGFGPSIVFFGSMNLKEPFLLLGVGIIYWSLERRPMGQAAGLIAGLGLCLLIRPYIGLLIGASVLLTLALHAFNRSRRPGWAFLGAACTVLAATTYGPAYVGVEVSQQRQFSLEAGGATLVAGPLSAAQVVLPWPPWVMPSSAGETLLYADSLLQGAMLLILLWVAFRRPPEISAQVTFAITASSAAFALYGLAIANAGTLARERMPFAVLLIAAFMVMRPSRHASNCSGADDRVASRGGRGSTGEAPQV